MQLRAINLTHTLTIAGALFGASNLPAPRNPAFFRRTDPNALAAMMFTSCTSNVKVLTQMLLVD